MNVNGVARITMPSRSARPCSAPGCAQLTKSGRFCRAHARAVERQRGSASQRGYDHHWEKARADYLTRHPLCATCIKDDRPVSATVVDHIVPHRGDPKLFWDSENNWQSQCTECHNRKTATEDGGFGR